MKEYRILIFILLSICLLCACSSNKSKELPITFNETIVSEENTTDMKSKGNEEKRIIDNIPIIDTNSKNQMNTQKVDENISNFLKMKISMKATANFPGNIIVIITNHSEKTIITGEEYQLQKWNGELWSDIPLSLVFSDIGIEITPGKSHEFRYSIENLVSLEKDTTYRIVKKVYVNQSEITLTTAFEIK